VHSRSKLGWIAAIAGVVLLLLIGGFWIHHTASLNYPAALGSSPSNGASSTGTGSGSASAPQDPIKLLLDTPAGQISGTDAAEYLAAIKKAGPSAQAEIEALCHSTDVKNRVVGAFLALETTGDLSKTIDDLAKDHSPFVSAEVGRWLFLNQHFDEWQKFIKAKAANLPPSDYEALLSPLDATVPALQLPAGAMILGVGKDYSDYARELIRDNAELSAEVQKQILAPDVNYNRQQALIALLQTADYPSYRNAMVTLKARTSPSDASYSRVSWLADQRPPTQYQMDKLSATVAAGTVGANGRPDAATASAIMTIAEASKYSQGFSMDKAALQKGISILDSITPQTYSIKKTREETAICPSLALKFS
jgi:hypothetical protein